MLHNWNNGLKPAKIEEVEQALGEVVQYGHNTTFVEPELQSFVQTDSIAHKLREYVLFNAGPVNWWTIWWTNRLKTSLTKH